MLSCYLGGSYFSIYINGFAYFFQGVGKGEVFAVATRFIVGQIAQLGGSEKYILDCIVELAHNQSPHMRLTEVCKINGAT